LSSELIKEKIKLSVALIENQHKGDPSIKMKILLKLFWHDCQNFIPKYEHLEFPYENFIESIFASFFTKSILCHEESLAALNILKERSVELKVDMKEQAPQEGYEKELYYLAHIKQYVIKFREYEKKSLEEPLKKLVVAFQNSVKKKKV
jgi:hypothetical protein